MSQTVEKITVLMVAKTTKEGWTKEMKERQGINGMERERCEEFENELVQRLLKIRPNCIIFPTVCDSMTGAVLTLCI